MTDKKNLATIKIYIDGKEMLYSHQNIIGAINSFLPYLTNDDLDELMLRFHSLKHHATLTHNIPTSESLNGGVTPSVLSRAFHYLQTTLPKSSECLGSYFIYSISSSSICFFIA